MDDPLASQEELYRFPYHWFPEQRLQKFEREEKQRIIIHLLEYYGKKRFQRYLDVGCGDGRWTSDLYEYLNKDVEAIGIDFSKCAIGFAKLISPDIDFRVHRGEMLPFETGSFDLVTAIEVIEHVDDGLEETFVSELHRVLRKDGVLLLTTPSWNLRLTHHHFRHYSIERLQNLLGDAGFHILDIRGQSIPCYGLKRRIRRRMNWFPFVWKFWRFTYRETHPKQALNLIVVAQPHAS
jgi:SAM-dependent methyltransferase